MREIKEIFGLPIYGELFEETIAPNEDLVGMPPDFQIIYFKLFTLFDLARDDRNRVKTMDWVNISRKADKFFYTSG